MFFFNMNNRMWGQYFVFCFIIGQWALVTTADNGPVYLPDSSQSSSSSEEEEKVETIFPTVTVRGFLNFRTTVDGTVIVFTPASETPQEPTPVSAAVTPSKIAAKSIDFQHKQYNKDRDDFISTELENEANTDDDRDTFKHIKPGLSEITTPEGETIPQKSIYGHTPSLPQYPTGLVTVLGGTHIKDGATTVFETKVIGTYIDGKYAQILQSTSQIIFSPSKSVKSDEVATPKPSPSKSPSATQTAVYSSKANPKKIETVSILYDETSNGPTSKVFQQEVLVRPAERRGDDLLNANIVLQTSFKIPESSSNRIIRPTQSLEKTKAQARSSYTVSRRFRPTVTADFSDDENTVPEFQNSRRMPPRFRYVLPRRNSPSVRLNRFKVKLTMRNDGDVTDRLVTPHENTFDPDDEPLEDYDPLQPIDPARITYQRTTITSEVTLHVGRRKSVRTLTITTSVPKTKHIYATDFYNDNHDILQANNAILATTLPDGDDIQQNIITRTYTTTERMLKTSLIPILDGNSTNYHTVTESFFILKLITGYKTLPPGDVTLLTSESSGSEIEITANPGLDGLLDGALSIDPAPHQYIVQTPVPNGLLQAAGSRREHAIVPLERSGGNQVDMSNPLLSLGAALQQNPLAAVYLGLQQLNRQATLYSTITQASTYVATDTIYSTKVVSIYDGRRTRTRTLSESVSTTEKTMTTYTTTVTPYLNTQLFPQNQLQQLLGTQLPGGMMPNMPNIPPPQPQFSTVTSTYTTVTTGTSLSTRIYTLIYNALSTKFRTVTSTSLFETTITATTTSEVPIAITAPPGGVFPFLG